MESASPLLWTANALAAVESPEVGVDLDLELHLGMKKHTFIRVSDEALVWNTLLENPIDSREVLALLHDHAHFVDIGE